jgi:HD-GYP domain-containing protein (c-di-GMP phosphodiesterase class II)
MVTARAYRPPLDPDVACANLREGAGSQFDPDAVDALLATLTASPVHAAGDRGPKGRDNCG